MISLRDLALALGVITLWGLHINVIRIGALEVPPLFLLCMRFSLCVLIFLPFAKKISRSELKNLFLYAFPYLGIHLSTLFIALRNIDSSLAGLLLQTEMPFAILIGWFFLGERFGLKTTIGLAIALIGVLLILYRPMEGFVLWGAIFCLISAFSWSIGAVRMKYIQSLDLPTMTAYSFAMMLPLIAVASYMLETDQIVELQNANHYKLGFVLFYQVILMSLCLFWWKGIMHRNPVYLVIPLTLLQPLITLLGGYFILGETLSTQVLMGGAVTAIGVAIVVLRKTRKAADPV